MTDENVVHAKCDPARREKDSMLTWKATAVLLGGCSTTGYVHSWGFAGDQLCRGCRQVDRAAEHPCDDEGQLRVQLGKN